MNLLIDWFVINYFELIAAALGLISIALQIRQNVWYWLLSIIMVAMYIIVYIEHTLYADMLLQIYYLLMSVYGWWSWLSGGNKTKGESSLQVTRLRKNLWVNVSLITILLFVALGWFMSNFTNSDVPWLDSFVTALSFVATWMLARKKIENWILWIFADAISIGLYWYKGMYPTLVLFIVLTALAFVGYRRWLNDLKPIET